VEKARPLCTDLGPIAFILRLVKGRDRWKKTLKKTSRSNDPTKRAELITRNVTDPWKLEVSPLDPVGGLNQAFLRERCSIKTEPPFVAEVIEELFAGFQR
jgi:hypothetical protein